MLKAAILGAGGISGAHIPCWQKMKEAELVAMCDICPEKMENYKNINKYTDFEEMLAKEKIDILDICLPTYLHAEYAVKALECGIHVICEKPVSLKKEDVARIYSAADKNNVKFMVAQVLRFWREYDFVKQVYDSKKYGELLSGVMSRVGSCPKWSEGNWMRDEARSGLVPFDLHIHDLDFMIYAFGKPKKMTPYRSKRPEQDYINVTYDFGSFFINSEAAWYDAPLPFAASFRFQFEKAVIVMENNKLVTYISSGEVIELPEEDSNDNGTIQLPKSDAYENEICYFTDCVLNNRTPERVKPEELETVIDVLYSL